MAAAILQVNSDAGKPHVRPEMIFAAAAGMLLAGCQLCDRGGMACAWPEGKDPETVSKRLSELLLSTDPAKYFPQGYESPSGCCKNGYGGRPFHYSVISLWVNALECARLTGNKDLEKRLVDLYEPYYVEKADKLPDFGHVDFTIVGSIPLEIAALTGDARAKAAGLRFADMQWEEPKPDDPPPPYNEMSMDERLGWWKQGYTSQTRLWIDDMYMINVLQGLAYRVTGEPSTSTGRRRKCVSTWTSSSSRTARTRDSSTMRRTCRTSGDAGTGGWRPACPSSSSISRPTARTARRSWPAILR